ncbi:MAG: hypothetical protein NTW87_28175 [Planctomycetota bacterium]|nr:hypothetical protein [Planctomycetota bacterium]
MRTTQDRAPGYRGHVANGVVVLDEPVRLPDGAEVRVQPLKRARRKAKRRARNPTLYERLKPLIGSLKGLPPDMAENHDHYIHGTPKRS